MNKFDRVIATLVLLQSKRIVTAAWLAEHFGVSVRTIYRDVQTLKTAGVPIIGDPGTGYSIMEGYRLPPVALNRDEALALLTAGKLVSTLADSQLELEYQSALTKIRAVLHGSDKEALSNLERGLSISVQHYGWEGQDCLQRLLAAVANQSPVQLYYQRRDSTPSERIVEPIGCYHYYGRWYLAAFCRKRNDYRTFALHRIQRFWSLNEGFEAERLPLQHYLEEQQANWKSQRVFYDMELVFAAPILNFVDRQKELYGLVREEPCEGGRRLFLRNDSIELVARWLLVYGDHVQVLRPKALHQRLRELASELYQHYQGTHNGVFPSSSLSPLVGPSTSS